MLTGWRVQICLGLRFRPEADLSSDVLDDLSMVALENPEQARRLVAMSGSCSFVSQAERTLAGPAETENES